MSFGHEHLVRKGESYGAMLRRELGIDGTADEPRDLAGEARRLGTLPLAAGYKAEAEFIARARTLLPELAQQLEQTEQRETRYREALVEIVEDLDTPTTDTRWAVNRARAALTPDEGADR